MTPVQQSVDDEMCYRVAISRKYAASSHILSSYNAPDPLCRDGIPSFGPPLPKSSIIKRDADGRKWLLLKCMLPHFNVFPRLALTFLLLLLLLLNRGSVINAERAAFRSPTFQKKFVNVRKFQLQYVLEDAKLEDEREHAMILLQHTTKCKRHFLFI